MTRKFFELASINGTNFGTGTFCSLGVIIRSFTFAHFWFESICFLVNICLTGSIHGHQYTAAKKH